MGEFKKVRCLEKRYANFTYGRIYVAVSRFVKIIKEDGVKRIEPAHFQITDDDGDTYTVAKTVHELKKNWEWVE